MHRKWRYAMAPWGFGRHSMKCIRRLVNSVAGCTKLRMFSIRCRSWCRRKPRLHCSRFGWRNLGLKRGRASISLSKSMRPNTPKPASVCCRTETSCWFFMTFQRTTGRVCAPPARLHQLSPRLVIAPNV